MMTLVCPRCRSDSDSVAVIAPATFRFAAGEHYGEVAEPDTEPMGTEDLDLEWKALCEGDACGFSGTVDDFVVGSPLEATG